jgi:hypothetical protein
VWKDLPLTAVLPAVLGTAIYMWWRNIFDLTPDAFLVFVSASLFFALIRWVMKRQRS